MITELLIEALLLCVFIGFFLMLVLPTKTVLAIVAIVFIVFILVDIVPY